MVLSSDQQKPGVRRPSVRSGQGKEKVERKKWKEKVLVGLKNEGYSSSELESCLSVCPSVCEQNLPYLSIGFGIAPNVCAFIQLL